MMGNRSRLELGPLEQGPLERFDQDDWRALTDRVRQIAADIFAVPLDGLTAESSPESIASWDSLNHLSLVLALEQEWSIQFSPEEMEELLSIAKIVSVVAEKSLER
jgi:acyl carrier protein